MLFLCILLGGDRGTEPASLEAFPLADCGCDGRAHILFAPAYPVLLHDPLRFTGTALLSELLFLMTALLADLFHCTVKHFTCRHGNAFTSRLALERRFVFCCIYLKCTKFKVVNASIRPYLFKRRQVEVNNLRTMLKGVWLHAPPRFELRCSKLPPLVAAGA
jgi:hypothetical protein